MSKTLSIVAPGTGARRLLLPVVLAAALLAAGAPSSPSAQAGGRLVGTIPGPGALGLVVWSGGSVQELSAALAGTPCVARSVWATRSGGGLVGYLFGAPEIVNTSFRGEYAGGVLPSMSPVVLVCAPVPTSAALTGVAPAPAVAPATDLPGGLDALAAAEAEMLALVNRERAANGLPLFTSDGALQDLARRHSADMVTRAYFSHTSPDGLDPFARMREAGITFQNAAENIAWAGSASAAHDALMNSPGHRANLLDPRLLRIGIGIVRKDSMHVMVTQVFTN